MVTTSDLALGLAVGVFVAILTHGLLLVARAICHVVYEVMDRLDIP